jgi:hypothetical protein
VTSPLPNVEQRVDDGAASMMIDDEEDEVIQTIPVYLSQDLVNQLYLLQYPLRPGM